MSALLSSCRDSQCETTASKHCSIFGNGCLGYKHLHVDIPRPNNSRWSPKPLSQIQNRRTYNSSAVPLARHLLLKTTICRTGPCDQ
jgi:hypothetical protein